ncbi:Uncharacterised protein [Shigella sonnei]|nr:Uncharacterised protein [Shigella sonnei]
MAQLSLPVCRRTAACSPQTMEGRMEGALEKALAIACQLQKMGMTPEQIKQATGLSDDELKKITH